MIGERERMMNQRSRSIDSTYRRSRSRSIENIHQHNNNSTDDADDDFNESDSSVTRIFKRRMRKKKKQQNKHEVQNDVDAGDQQNFDMLRRRLSR